MLREVRGGERDVERGQGRREIEGDERKGGRLTMREGGKEQTAINR